MRKQLAERYQRSRLRDREGQYRMVKKNPDIRDRKMVQAKFDNSAGQDNEDKQLEREKSKTEAEIKNDYDEEHDEELGADAVGGRRNELETGMSRKKAKGGDYAESDEEVVSNEGEQLENEKSQPEAEIKNDHHEEHDEELGEDAVGGRRNELETGMSKKKSNGGHSAESDEEVGSNEGEQFETEKSQPEAEIKNDQHEEHDEELGEDAVGGRRNELETGMSKKMAKGG